jgi:hypothetical protein
MQKWLKGLFGTGEQGYSQSHPEPAVLYINESMLHVIETLCSSRISKKETCRRRNPASKEKEKTMDKRKQPTQQQLSFPNFYTSLRRRVQSQNTKVHWTIPLPRSCQHPSFSILFSTHQAGFPSVSCKTSVTSFHRQRFHLYPLIPTPSLIPGLPPD